MFEGVVGSTAIGDIAIDDVEFLENTKCASTAETLGNRPCSNVVGFKLLRNILNIGTKKFHLRFNVKSFLVFSLTPNISHFRNFQWKNEIYEIIVNKQTINQKKSQKYLALWHMLCILYYCEIDLYL